MLTDLTSNQLFLSQTPTQATPPKAYNHHLKSLGQLWGPPVYILI